MVLIQGSFDALTGKKQLKEISSANAGKHLTGAASNDIETADIKFSYCTEFIIYAQFDDKKEREFKEFLTTMGDSVVCVADDDIVKVHVHTNDPGVVISRALTYGALTRLKIDNMKEEHNELYTREVKGEITKVVFDEPEKPHTHAAMVAVCAGDGLEEIFKGLGVSQVISGGQTMNPSTEDIVEAISHVNADTVFVFPNNKNIIMAAKQAAELTEDKKVIVIPTKSVPEGIGCAIAFVPDGDDESNTEDMTAAADAIKTGEVTYAVRDTSIDGFDIEKGDIMVIGEDGMLAVDKDMSTAVTEALKKLVDEDSQLVTIYYGNEVDEKQARELRVKVDDMFPNVDFEVAYGGQFVYYYLISVE